MPRAAIVIAAALSLLAQAAAAQNPARIARFPRAPVMDGSLDDPEWGQATVFSDFRTLHPEAGQEPSERTVVYLGYDRDSIYVGIRAHDASPDSMRAVATEPDAAWGDDWTAFCLDTRASGLDAFYFLVTPAGLRLAGSLRADGGPAQTLDLAWVSAVRRAADGYTIEMAIPLARLPFTPGNRVAMAFKVARAIQRRSEEMDSPAIDPARPHLAQLRPIVLTDIVRGATPADRPLFDVRAAHARRAARLAGHADTTFAVRVEAWSDASILDYLDFPSRPLARSTRPFVFPRRLAEDSVAARFDHLEYLPGRPIRDLDRFLTRTLTTSLIVVRHDTIIYERYFSGWRRDSIFTSFSVAKAFVSTLVGIAVDRGLIRSVSDPITAYLPELAGRDPRFARITIRDLLRMASGLRYVEDEPPYDNRTTYLETDLRRAGLEGSTIVEAPGTRWLYNNYNPLLLGMVLERVSHRSVTDLLQDWIWTPLGMEFGGSWSLDSRADGFETMESGINARPIDYAKLGRLYLDDGAWGGQRIVSKAWVHDATQPWPDPPGYYQDQGFFGPGGHYFGYFWWGDRRERGESDYHTVGNKGQYIYCSPQKGLIIVRTGIDFGIGSARWLRLFRQFADQF